MAATDHYVQGAQPFEIFKKADIADKRYIRITPHPKYIHPRIPHPLCNEFKTSCYRPQKLWSISAPCICPSCQPSRKSQMHRGNKIWQASSCCPTVDFIEPFWIHSTVRQNMRSFSLLLWIYFLVWILSTILPSPSLLQYLKYLVLRQTTSRYIFQMDILSSRVKGDQHIIQRNNLRLYLKIQQGVVTKRRSWLSQYKSFVLVNFVVPLRFQRMSR